MSERTEVEVLLPVDHVPTRSEHEGLKRAGFDAAWNLVRQHGGRVLGLASIARARTARGELALRMRFAVDVPESAHERPQVFTIDRKPGERA